MAAHIFRNCVRKRWVSEHDFDAQDGIAIRRGRRDYVVYPHDSRLSDFAEAVKALNCAIAVTLSAEVVQLVVGSFDECWDTFSLSADDHIQIVESMAECAARSLAAISSVS